MQTITDDGLTDRRRLQCENGKFTYLKLTSIMKFLKTDFLFYRQLNSIDF